MSEETNQEKNDNIEENNIEDTPNKKNKTKRKRKELINDDSDEEEHLKNKNSSKKNKEESKEEENTEYSNNTRQSKYTNNKFSTIDKNNIGSSPFKDNPALQEKLKKIFMNRDKLKFQYMKHDIPDNLKYHSDDSDSSDVSGLKKSKILKKNNLILSEQNENDKECEINNSNKKHKSISIKDNINEGSNHKHSPNIKSNKEDSEKKDNISIGKEYIKDNDKKEEKTKKLNKNKIKCEKKRFNSLIINKNENDEEEQKEKSNKKIEKIFNMENFKNKININNKGENEEKKNENIGYEKEEEFSKNKDNKKDNQKNNIQLKEFKKKNKNDKDIDFSENKEPEYNDEQEEEDNKKINPKHKLLKLLIKKKNNNSNDDNNNNLNKNNNNHEIKNENKDIDNEDEDEEDKEKTLKMKYDNEKEARRRKIIKQIKSDSNNSAINKNYEKSEKKESKEKNEKNEEINKIEREFDEEEEKDEEKEEQYKNVNKDIYVPTSHKNKLTKNLKPKNELQEEKINKNIKEINNENEEENDNNDEEQLTQSKTASDLLNILGKLKQKKALEIKPKNISKNKEEIDEIEIEKEPGKLNKKEKKLEEKTITKKNKKQVIKEEEIEIKKNNTNSFYYNKKRRISNKEIKKNELSSEELKRRKKLEEDLQAEINKKESNDFKDDEISTVNNSKSYLVNYSYLNNQSNQIEKEEKYNYKDIPIRNTSNIGNRYKNLIEDNNVGTDIMLNDLPPTNLDRSFDATNAYRKRKIPKAKNTVNIYRHKKVNNNVRNKSLIENSSKSFNPNQNMILNNANNIYNSPNYYRNNYALSNNNFIRTNHSFCEYPIDNSNPDSVREKNNINIEMNSGGGLNSSFDAYMKANINNFNNNNDGNIFKVKKNLFYGNTNKKYNTSVYNQKTNIPNCNYSKNSNNMNSYINNNYYKNKNGNKSFGYLNTGFKNNIFDNNNINNINNINNNNYNRNTCKTNNNYFYGKKNQEFTKYNNNNMNNNQNTYVNYNNIPLRTYGNQPITDLSDNYDRNIYSISPDIPKRYPSSKVTNIVNNIKTPSNINNKINYTYINNGNNNANNSSNKNPNNNDNNNGNNIANNNANNNYSQYQYQSNQNSSDNNTSINIEDLLVLEEKFKDILVSLSKNGQMHYECFEFWNYYFNCSLYGRLEKLFKTEDILNVQISINHLLMSVMICYDFSFEIDILKGEFSYLEDILHYNHKNLINIYEHILSKVSSESKSNIWVLKLHNLIDNFNKMNNSQEYNMVKGRQISSVEKIIYNTTVIVQYIRSLLKNYKTKRIEYLTSIFKKISDKKYDEINSYFRDNILRTDNLSGSILASSLKEKEFFQTEPSPYIKTKNRKPYSLILDLDETLIHFKVNNEDDTEGVLKIRPGVLPFLDKVGKYYELIIFTAATQDYGDLLIDAIEENNVYFEHRFYRQHTVIIGNDFVKDLRRIGRPLDKMIIVDNMPQNFRLQKENGINIKAFWGEDVDDNALEELGIILTNIAQEGGDLRNGLVKYRDEIIRKVTSNISKNNY